MIASSHRHVVVAAILAATATFVGCGGHEAERTEAELAPVAATVALVESITDGRMIEVRGTVQPGRQATVSSRVTGPVVSVEVRSGQEVAAGQTLIRIQAEASDGRLGQASGALAQARAALAPAERNYERYQALHAENAASELELDMARMQFEQARGAVEQAEGAFQAATSVAAESDVEAPFAGRVVRTHVEIGDLAAPGRPLVTVESRGGREIWLEVRESDIQRLEVGDTVKVQIDARPGLGDITATVREIVPAADPATHTFTVKTGLDGVEIPTGLSGRGFFPGDDGRRLVVPARAVHRRGGLELVVVRAADGAARTRAVTTGQSVGADRVEVLSGLDEGDEIAVDLAGPVADGTPLEVAR